jgi:adenosylcobinamide kinase/adenosylcobinamide-phosphate guanylyltransferase
MPLVLVTGGARSGKSAFAQRRAEAFAAPRLYIATGEPGDDEMRERIARHREARGAGWQTAESPTDPAAALATPANVVVLDCLTLWVSNLLLAGRDDDAIAAAAASLADSCAVAAVPIYAVTNEVGLGIVPEHAVARRFRDLAGRVNQTFGARAVEVWLLVCGQPLRIK